MGIFGGLVEKNRRYNEVAPLREVTWSESVVCAMARDMNTVLSDAPYTIASGKIGLIPSPVVLPKAQLNQSQEAQAKTAAKVLRDLNLRGILADVLANPEGANRETLGLLVDGLVRRPEVTEQERKDVDRRTYIAVGFDTPKSRREKTVDAKGKVTPTPARTSLIGERIAKSLHLNGPWGWKADF